MFIPSKAAKVIVSKHTTERLLQRYRLFIPEEKRNNFDLLSLVHTRFRKSEVDKKICFSPFYKNKLETRHGKGAFISRNGIFTFAGKYDPNINTVWVRTVWIER